ncbi:MAG TPA: tripartite tricarboxylate transporter substrate-binding protein [Ramlibacter sp.]
MKRCLSLLLGVLACGIAAAQPAAPAPPAQGAPLVILVGGPPGTPGDVVARAISGPLGAELGQPVVVENRPGAAGTVALAAVARARGDGNVLGVLALQSAVAPALIRSLPYDTQRDLVPVRQLSSVGNLLVVRADSPFQTLEDLLRAGRAGTLTYASGGNGTPAHLAAELFAHEARAKLQHVPFNGAVAGVTAVLGGHVQMMFATAPAAAPLVQSGRLRAIAASSGQRLAVAPSVPTFAEGGLAAVTVRDWHGLVAPAGAPPERVAQVAAAAGRALSSDAVRARLEAAGLEPATVSGPGEFGAWVRAEMERWAAVVHRAGISLQ